jgi:predicted aspartyl protease
MKITRYDPAANLIIVSARLWGPTGKVKLKLALDTAASLTVIVPEVIDGLGYSPRDGEQITTISSAIGKEPGYTTRVSRFWTLGFSVNDFRVHVHDLGDNVGIDGLIGLNFLREFNVELRPGEGRLRVDRIAASP